MIRPVFETAATPRLVLDTVRSALITHAMARPKASTLAVFRVPSAAQGQPRHAGGIWGG
jgi:hypothetical protein